MISVFDMFSVGIGPSSSHTVGPMKAGAEFVTELAQETALFDSVDSVKVELFGSLGQTGIGHGTGKAVILGLLGELPDVVDVNSIETKLEEIRNTEKLCLNGQKLVRFPNKNAIVFHRRKTLPKHANALTFYAYAKDELVKQQTYYSIGGGFIIKDEDFDATKAHAASLQASVPFPFKTAGDLLALCKTNGLSISSLMLRNESTFRPKHEVKQQLHNIWLVMKACIQRGIESEGILPGGLKVVRRAPGLYRRLQTEHTNDPMQTMDWVNLFALAVNEENAAGGRVVTAPTNGAAGIIPAIIRHYCYEDSNAVKNIRKFLLTAGGIGLLYKQRASISGAEMGCQGEVGVACSMAAAGLAAIWGGSPSQIAQAAEIGMEHNLGLTCDPVGGLVQIPCIERNAIGAVKAVNAARLSLHSEGKMKVSLDQVIETMRQTGLDMSTKYKETSQGGLAVNVVEC